jgi:hypothetical protein
VNQRRIKHRPTVVIGALFALGLGLSSAGLITSDTMPRLTSGDTQASAALRDANVHAPRFAPQFGQQALTELQRSLQRISAPTARNGPHPHRTGPERLQTLLAELSAGHVAVDLNRIGRDLGVAARQDDAPRIDIAMLDSALRRFDRVSGPVASDTFARVYLGLSEMVPKLSDSTAYHTHVPKADLRAQIIEERTAEARFAASRAASPTLLGATAPVDMSLDDPAAIDIAGLTAPVGQLALSAMTAVPDDLGSALPYDEAQLALDDIDMDSLGNTDLASLESVDAEQLQETRAGFILDNGVQIDFNVTRHSTIDELGPGVEVLTNLPQGLNQASLSQITAAQDGRNTNTRVISQTQDTAVFSVIQNSLDNQVIRDVTTVNIDIKNLGLRSLDFVPENLRGGAIPSEFKGGR